jgi:hypothetical protein
MAKRKLDPEFKSKWVDALTGGKYAQAGGVLNNGKGGFCCLGVLCDITGEKWTSDRGDDSNGIMTEEGEELMPDSDRIERWGMEFDTAETLSKHNDNGKSFKWIAAYINRYL